MRITWLVVVGTCLVVGACSEGQTLLSPNTSQTASVIQPQVETVVTEAEDAPEDPSEAPGTPFVPVLSECRGIHNTESHMAGNGLSVSVKNLCLPSHLESEKNYVFALFKIAPNGTQTLVSLKEKTLKAGESTTLSVSLGEIACYQTDLYTEITIARINSGATKINPGQEGQPGFVSPISGQIYEIGKGCSPPPPPPPPTCETDERLCPPPPPPPPVCEDFDAPVLSFTGAPSVNINAVDVLITQGTLPGSYTTYTPSLPFYVSRPAYGQPNGTWSFSGLMSQSYGPENLQCIATASANFSGVIPAQPPPPPPVCGVQTNPGATTYLNWPTDIDVSGPGSNWTLSGSVKLDNVGPWSVRLYAGSAQSEYNTNSPDYTKDTETATVNCGATTTVTVSYKWDNHPSNYWWIAVYKNGLFFSKSSVIINTHN